MENNGTILIVDDEPFNVRILAEYLSLADYQAETASDGLIAWELLSAHPERYDAVLLDRMMPNMNGMEVLAKMKAHPQLKQLPVIMQTAAASKQDILDGLKAGAYYYLTKPFEHDMLMSIVCTAVNDYQRYHQLQQDLMKTSRLLLLLNNAEFLFSSLKDARDLARLLASVCPEPSVAILGLSELLINAIEHGNLEITYDEKTHLNNEGVWEQEVDRRLMLPEYQLRKAIVRFQRLPGGLSFEILDEGKGFDWEHYLEMRPERVFDNHGRGIAMAKMLSFSQLEYLGKGNHVRAIVSLASE